MACCISMGTTLCYRAPSASLSLLTGSRTSISFSVSAKPKAQVNSGALHSTFTPSSLSISSASSFSGGFGSSIGSGSGSGNGKAGERRRGLIVRASRFRLCQTKRNRSRKSLARTHGFRKRMGTTSGRAVIRRRRAKGRWDLCTKTNPNSGKRA